MICTSCKIDKELTLFSVRKDTKFGYRRDCKVCEKTVHKRRKDKQKEYTAKYDKIRYATNRLHRLQQTKKWQQNNKAHANMLASRYRCAKLNRTPAWLTAEELQQIADFYELAAFCTEESMNGTIYHVDHIIPLQGKNVSGFHCPSNLQVISAQENIIKGNRYEQELFKNI